MDNTRSIDKSPVSSRMLEDRVSSYLQAIDYATTTHDFPRQESLQKCIQILMDLMEQVNLGKVVTADRVPPPIPFHASTDRPMENPLGALSKLQNDYHKALYFADIETGVNRIQQIHTLQRGLQTLQKLNNKAAAGYPVFASEVPPPVTLPSDDEFLVDSKSVITERIALYKQAIKAAQAEGQGNNTIVTALMASVEKMQYLLMRAQANVPIYKKDLPSPPPMEFNFRKQSDEFKKTVKVLKKMAVLSSRAANLAAERGNTQMESQLRNNVKMLAQVLHDYKMGKPLDMTTFPYSLADIERLADEAGVPDSEQIQDKEFLRLRCEQYKAAALKAKSSGDNDVVLQHMRVVKDLQRMLGAAEKGEAIDLVQVPPPPQDQQPVSEAITRSQTQGQKPSSPNLGKTTSNIKGKHLANELSAFLDDPTGLEFGFPPYNSEGLGSEIHDSQLSAETSHSSRTFLQNVSMPNKPSLNSEKKKSPPPSNSILPESNILPGINGKHYPPNILDQSLLQKAYSSQNGILPKTVDNSRVVPPSSQLIDSSERHQTLSFPLTNGEQVKPHRDQEFLGHGITDGHQISSQKNVVKNNNLVIGAKEKDLSTDCSPDDRSSINCIEILKYQCLLADQLDDSNDKIGSEKLVKRIEKTKQWLLTGEYEAWLEYFSMVEDDLMHINQSMKTAREARQDETLSTLIVQKELAERELAVMRKRLPELQTEDFNSDKVPSPSCILP